MLDFSSYPRFALFKNKSILAIDFGFKVTGTALYKVGIDPFPYPFEKIIFKDTQQVLQHINNIINDEAIDIVVFGLPYYIDGKESEMTLKLKAIYLELISMNKHVLYFTQDETLTTETAKDRMLNSPEYNFKIDLTRIDTLAATIILEDFMREMPEQKN